MKTKIFSIVLMFTAFVSFAQQDAQFTQYMYNTININPAYAGSRGALRWVLKIAFFTFDLKKSQKPFHDLLKSAQIYYYF